MFDASGYEIPERILAGLVRYGRHGVPTGGFLNEVLSNNLRESIVRADKDSLAALRDIVLFVHNEMPGGCHGSPEKVKAWIKKACRTERGVDMTESRYTDGH